MSYYRNISHSDYRNYSYGADDDTDYETRVPRPVTPTPFKRSQMTPIYRKVEAPTKSFSQWNLASSNIYSDTSFEPTDPTNAYRPVVQRESHSEEPEEKSYRYSVDKRQEFTSRGYSTKPVESQGRYGGYQPVAAWCPPAMQTSRRPAPQRAEFRPASRAEEPFANHYTQPEPEPTPVPMQAVTHEGRQPPRNVYQAERAPVFSHTEPYVNGKSEAEETPLKPKVNFKEEPMRIEISPNLSPAARDSTGDASPLASDDQQSKTDSDVPAISVSTPEETPAFIPPPAPVIPMVGIVKPTLSPQISQGPKAPAKSPPSSPLTVQTETDPTKIQKNAVLDELRAKFDGGPVRPSSRPKLSSKRPQTPTAVEYEPVKKQVESDFTTKPQEESYKPNIGWATAPVKQDEEPSYTMPTPRVETPMSRSQYDVPYFAPNSSVEPQPTEYAPVYAFSSDTTQQQNYPNYERSQNGYGYAADLTEQHPQAAPIEQPIVSAYDVPVIHSGRQEAAFSSFNQSEQRPQWTSFNAAQPEVKLRSKWPPQHDTRETYQGGGRGVYAVPRTSSLFGYTEPEFTSTSYHQQKFSSNHSTYDSRSGSTRIKDSIVYTPPQQSIPQPKAGSDVRSGYQQTNTRTSTEFRDNQSKSSYSTNQQRSSTYQSMAPRDHPPKQLSEPPLQMKVVAPPLRQSGRYQACTSNTIAPPQSVPVSTVKLNHTRFPSSGPMTGNIQKLQQRFTTPQPEDFRRNSEESYHRSRGFKITGITTTQDPIALRERRRVVDNGNQRKQRLIIHSDPGTPVLEQPSPFSVPPKLAFSVQHSPRSTFTSKTGSPSSPGLEASVYDTASDASDEVLPVALLKLAPAAEQAPVQAQIRYKPAPTTGMTRYSETVEETYYPPAQHSPRNQMTTTASSVSETRSLTLPMVNHPFGITESTGVFLPTTVRASLTAYFQAAPKPVITPVAKFETKNRIEQKSFAQNKMEQNSFADSRTEQKSFAGNRTEQKSFAQSRTEQKSFVGSRTEQESFAENKTDQMSFAKAFEPPPAVTPKPTVEVKGHPPVTVPSPAPPPPQVSPLAFAPIKMGRYVSSSIRAETQLSQHSAETTGRSQSEVRESYSSKTTKSQSTSKFETSSKARETSPVPEPPKPPPQQQMQPAPVKQQISPAPAKPIIILNKEKMTSESPAKAFIRLSRSPSPALAPAKPAPAPDRGPIISQAGIHWSFLNPEPRKNAAFSSKTPICSAVSADFVAPAKLLPPEPEPRIKFLPLEPEPKIQAIKLQTAISKTVTKLNAEEKADERFESVEGNVKDLAPPVTTSISRIFVQTAPLTVNTDTTESFAEYLRSPLQKSPRAESSASSTEAPEVPKPKPDAEAKLEGLEPPKPKIVQPPEEKKVESTLEPTKLDRPLHLDIQPLHDEPKNQEQKSPDSIDLSPEPKSEEEEEADRQLEEAKKNKRSYTDIVAEQLRKCQNIVHSLVSPDKQTKAHKMFSKRKNRVDKLIESKQTEQAEAEKPEPPTQTPSSVGGSEESPSEEQPSPTGRSSLPKAIRNPAGDYHSHIEKYGELLTHDSSRAKYAATVNESLQSSGSRAGIMFAARRERAEKYVTDSSNVKRPMITMPIMTPPSQDHTWNKNRQKQEQEYQRWKQNPSGLAYVKSPWQAALEDYDPYAAFKQVRNTAGTPAPHPVHRTSSDVSQSTTSLVSIDQSFEDMKRELSTDRVQAAANRPVTPSLKTSFPATSYQTLPRSWKDFRGSMTTGSGERSRANSAQPD